MQETEFGIPAMGRVHHLIQTYTTGRVQKSSYCVKLKTGNAFYKSYISHIFCCLFVFHIQAFSGWNKPFSHLESHKENRLSIWSLTMFLEISTSWSSPSLLHNLFMSCFTSPSNHFSSLFKISKDLHSLLFFFPPVASWLSRLWVFCAPSPKKISKVCILSQIFLVMKMDVVSFKS